MTPAALKDTRLRLGFRSRRALAEALGEIGFPTSWRTVEGWEQGHPKTPIPRWLPLALEKLAKSIYLPSTPS